MKKPAKPKGTKAERRRKAIRWLQSFDKIELPPCRHCGRVMLAGWCCKKALKEGP